MDMPYLFCPVRKLKHRQVENVDFWPGQLSVDSLMYHELRLLDR